MHNKRQRVCFLNIMKNFLKLDQVSNKRFVKEIQEDWLKIRVRKRRIKNEMNERNRIVSICVSC